MPQTNISLCLENLSYTYHSKEGETKALSDINFCINPGEFIAIVGVSGCGKSTLLDLIGGFLPLQSGSISFYRKDSDNPSKSLRLQTTPSIGYMLQKDHLLEYRTIYKNIILGLEIRKQRNKKNIYHIEHLMKEYDIFPFADAKPSQLSGGMRQRAALIRTLAVNPDVLLLDEPFSALDYQTRLMVVEDISSIIRKRGITTLLVTHDLAEAISIADRIVVLGRRPATVKNIFPIDFDSPVRPGPEEARNHPRFQYYFHKIWKELKSDV